MRRGGGLEIVGPVVPFVLAGAADSESETDVRLRVDPPKTDSVDSFGEGNVGTGESGARIASTETDDDMAAAAAAPRP